jgi:hypothetical protein
MPDKLGPVTLLLLACVAIGVAQRVGTTTLALQVNPEARLEPQQVALNFRVSADGASDVTTQTANFTASVRALPGRPIRVTARLSSLHGPDGSLPASALRWSGSATRASAGGQSATCSSGTFQSGVAHDLAQGWQHSGTLGCSVKFELAAPRTLTPGLYSGAVELIVGAP